MWPQKWVRKFKPKTCQSRKKKGAGFECHFRHRNIACAADSTKFVQAAPPIYFLELLERRLTPHRLFMYTTTPASSAHVACFWDALLPHMRLRPQTSAPQPGDFAAQAFSAVRFRAPTVKPILPKTRLSPELPVSSAALLIGSPIPVQIQASIRGRPGIPICLHSHFESHCAFISDMVFRSVSRYRR